MNLLDLLKSNRILPIIRSTEPKEIIEKVGVIKNCGLDIVEINLVNTSIYEVLKDLSSDIKIVAGGVITEIQAQAAVDCGAKIISSPIFQKSLTKFSKDKLVPYIAGISTANEAYEAWKSRIPVVKLFPITAMGGVQYIENLLRPMPFLNVIPQGDVKLKEIYKYVNAGAISVGVGRDLTNLSISEMHDKLQQTLESLAKDVK